MAKRLLVKKRKELLSELSQDIPANGIITVGNDTSATIELNDEQVAPEQFVIVCEDGEIKLLCRAGGGELNGELLPQGALHFLRSGDVASIGNYSLTVEPEENGDRPANGGRSETSAYSSEFQPNQPIRPPGATPAAAPEKNERSLSDVLENLRSEEKFYFLIKETSGENRRVYVETEEMWLGWAETGECVLSGDAAEVGIARAQIRKDWSGVVLYPLKNGSVWLNDETLTEPRRLKNDDKIFLLSKEGARLSLETVIKFHEPTALLILDSILPKELPPPILLDEAANDPGTKEIDETDLIHSSRIPPSSEKPPDKRQIFGHFTVIELIIMAIGTLITAAVIFLVLELY